MTEYEIERERALEQDAMTQGEYHAAALAQYAGAHGADRPERAWILTPFDTWERNPSYAGPPVPHPEANIEDGDALAPPAARAPVVRFDADDDCPF